MSMSLEKYEMGMEGVNCNVQYGDLLIWRLIAGSKIMKPALSDTCSQSYPLHG